MSDFLQIKKISAYLPPESSEVKIGSDDPHSKDILFTPNLNDPSTTGKWGELLNEGTFVEIQASFKELKAFLDDSKPIIDQLVDYTNEIDLFRKNNDLKGFGIGINKSNLTTNTNGWINIHGYDNKGIPTQTDGWFYHLEDENQLGGNSNKLVKKKQIIKQKSFGAIPSSYESDLLFVVGKYLPSESKWVPFVIAIKEEFINETNTNLTVSEWDKNTESLSKRKVVSTDLKYPNHSTKQYEIINVFNVPELTLNQNEVFNYESIQSKTNSLEYKEWDSNTESEKTTTGNFNNKIQIKENLLVFGLLNLKLNVSQPSFYNCVTFLNPISFDQISDLIKIKKDLLKEKITRFTDNYKIFKKIQLEIEERKLDINTLKADIEQKIREYIVKKKDNELRLEYFNNTHETKYDVLTKSKEYPSTLNETKRIISAPLLGETIKELWLHGTNSSKILKLGLAGDFTATQSILDSGFLIKGNTEINKTLIVKETSRFDGNSDFKKNVTINGNLNLPTGKITAYAIEATNNLISNITTINGLQTNNANVVMNKELTLKDNVTMLGNKLLTIHSNSIFNGLLTVNNNVVLNNSTSQNTTINGALNLKHTLTVDKQSIFKDNVRIDNSKKLTADLIDVNTLDVKTKALINILTVSGITTFNNDVNIPNNTLTTKNLTVTNNTILNSLTSQNSSLGETIIRENLTVKKNTLLEGTLTTNENTILKKELTVNGISNFNQLLNANKGIKIADGFGLNTDTLTAKTITVSESFTSNKNTNLQGILTVGATSTYNGNTVFNSTITSNNTITANKTLTTNQIIARELITAQKGITSNGEIITSTNLKANTIYQADKTLDDTYLRKFEGSTGVASLNVPRESTFLIQRNVTNQIDLKRADGYDKMLYNSRLNKFEYKDEIRFYPGANCLSFKDENNIISFSEINHELNNSHLFIAFDIKEKQNKEKTFLTLQLEDSKKIIFKLNTENKVVMYLDSNKIFEVNVFKDIEIRREVFGLIFNENKVQLIHDGNKLIDQSIPSLNQNQQIKKIIIGSVDNSLIFNLYTLLLGNYDGSQWQDIIGSNQKNINYQYSQEVYQCFGNFKYHENFDEVNFSFESVALPIASIHKKGITQLTNIIEDREDIAVTPRALINFNVQNIYQQKYYKNLKFNIKKGLTDTINSIKPNGYNLLNLTNTWQNGNFENSLLKGKITKQGIQINSTNKINYQLSNLNNWFFIITYKNKQLQIEDSSLNLFKKINFDVNHDVKTLERDFLNYIVVHSSGKFYFNGELLKTETINDFNWNEFSIYSEKEFYIESLSIFDEVIFNEAELTYISKYGFETDISIEDAPLYNCNCNWNQLRNLIRYSENQLNGIEEEIITKDLLIGETKIIFNEINKELLTNPKFFADGILLSSDFYTWDESKKEFNLNGIKFTHKKQITCLFKYRNKTDEIIYLGNQGISITRNENESGTLFIQNKIII